MQPSQCPNPYDVSWRLRRVHRCIDGQLATHISQEGPVPEGHFRVLASSSQVSWYRNVEHIYPTLGAPNNINKCAHIWSRRLRRLRHFFPHFSTFSAIRAVPLQAAGAQPKHPCRNSAGASWNSSAIPGVARCSWALSGHACLVDSPAFAAFQAPSLSAAPHGDQTHKSLFM